ncbi:MAG TPA: hypothetical protein ENF38_01590 [Candidatus Aenigmarchaeota archaeon]|nr:hypothetical protein [Candidatus Aenigmarchaeota archaeon]
MSEQQQRPNPYQQFQSLLEYLGKVNTQLDQRKTEKQNYENLLKSYIGSLSVGKIDLEFFGVVQTLAEQTYRLYSQRASRGWVREAIRRAPDIYDSLNTALQLYLTLLTQRTQLVQGELERTRGIVQNYTNVLREIRQR